MKIAVVGLAADCHNSVRGMIGTVMTEFKKRGIETRYFFVCKPGRMEASLLSEFGQIVPDQIVRHYDQHERYMKMAHLRNRYLDAVRASGFVPDIVLMLDMDILGIDCWAGLDALVERNDWGSVATTGLWPAHGVKSWHAGPHIPYQNGDYVYYDTLAFEDLQGVRSLWRHGHGYYPHGEVPPETRFKIGPPEISLTDWTKVNCAFGPAAFYRWDAIKDFRYPADSMQIEHYALSKHIRDQGRSIFVSHDIISLYSRT